jgi:hypothetical protein
VYNLYPCYVFWSPTKHHWQWLTKPDISRQTTPASDTEDQKLSILRFLITAIYSSGLCLRKGGGSVADLYGFPGEMALQFPCWVLYTRPVSFVFHTLQSFNHVRWDFRQWERWILGLMWHRIIWQISTYVSEEPAASNFRVEETITLSLWNAGTNPPNCTMSQS